MGYHKSQSMKRPGRKLFISPAGRAILFRIPLILRNGREVIESIRAKDYESAVKKAQVIFPEAKLMVEAVSNTMGAVSTAMTTTGGGSMSKKKTNSLFSDSITSASGVCTLSKSFYGVNKKISFTDGTRVFRNRSTTTTRIDGSFYGSQVVHHVVSDDILTKAGIQATYATEPTPTDTNSKEVITVCKQTTEFTISNVDESTVFVDIYDIVARRHTGDAVKARWTTDAAAINAANLINLYGNTPFGVSGWCSLFRIRKITRVILPQGSLHKHVVTVAPFKEISKEVINLTSMIPNITHAIMFVCKGSPLNDSTSKTLVSTSMPHLDIVAVSNIIVKYKIQPIQSFVETTTSGMDTITLESVIIPGVGAPDTGDNPA